MSLFVPLLEFNRGHQKQFVERLSSQDLLNKFSVLEGIQTAPFGYNIGILNPKSKHLRAVVLGFGHSGAGSVSTTDNDAARAVVFLGQKVQPYRLNNP
ncbi:MAG: hypothetical protein QOI53_472 [Verrucomicrobiota bacterium]|jgi:formylmethanofuran dehydrogenase subunit E-like metal-binding protein|nr:hypothetical protein [Verrucomicrobiota bacterium]